jgi:hypothetical protein
MRKQKDLIRAHPTFDPTSDGTLAMTRELHLQASAPTPDTVDDPARLLMNTQSFRPQGLSPFGRGPKLARKAPRNSRVGRR